MTTFAVWWPLDLATSSPLCLPELRLPLAAHPLVHVNATLNALATLLLVAGLVLIKRRREEAHRRVMLSAFCVSIAFLVCYLWYHYLVGSVKFTGTGIVRPVYFVILISHIVLAAIVPPLAIATIVLGQRATGRWLAGGSGQTQEQSQRKQASSRGWHRTLARWTFPIWLYVSVTGVVVYLMLYHLYPAPPP